MLTAYRGKRAEWAECYHPSKAIIVFKFSFSFKVEAASWPYWYRSQVFLKSSPRNMTTAQSASDLNETVRHDVIWKKTNNVLNCLWKCSILIFKLLVRMLLTVLTTWPQFDHSIAFAKTVLHTPQQIDSVGKSALITSNDRLFRLSNHLYGY